MTEISWLVLGLMALAAPFVVYSIVRWWRTA